MKYYRNCQIKPSEIKRRVDEEVVKDGLAMSPSQMLELVERGIPISNSSLQLLEVYKTGDNDFNVPLEFQRHVDLADMFQHREETRHKVRKASVQYLKDLREKIALQKGGNDGGE